MANYTADSRDGGIEVNACFSHWFSQRDYPKEWVRLFLRDLSGDGQFYIDDFARWLIPAKTWKHITQEDASPEDGRPDLNFKWKFTFDVRKLDATSLFFALTVLRYPCEFPALTSKYRQLRAKRDNRSLCFIAPHVFRNTLDNFNHTLTHWRLFNTQNKDALLKYDFRDQYPTLNEEEPYVISRGRRTIYDTLYITKADPYTYGNNGIENIKLVFESLFEGENS